MDGLVARRVVYFVFNQTAAHAVERQRLRSPGSGETGGGGNPVRVGDILPALVVQTWGAESTSINLKVMLDGPDTYWATSIPYDAAKTPGTWHWMFDGQQKRYTPGTVPA